MESPRLGAWRLREAFKSPVFSIKGHLGQTGAVTPIYQFISACLATRSATLPGTLNMEELDEDLEGLNVVTRTGPYSGGPILCHAIGFGGYYYSAFVVGSGG